MTKPKINLGETPGLVIVKDAEATPSKWVSWSFKKASSFKDIVTYTGNGKEPA